ncbi:MAG: hypothetical protein AAF846_14755 [Chloroflexota bacterium]
MPHELSWHTPRRIAHARIFGDMGMEQLNAFTQELQHYVEDGDAPIHVLLDDSEAGPPPLTIKEARAIFDMDKIDLTQLGWFVGIVEPKLMAKIMLPLMSSMMDIQYKRFDNIDDAIAFLEEEDATLSLSY